MIDADLLVTNIRELLTCRGPAPLVGPRQRDVTSQSNAALAVKNGVEPHAGHGLTYENVQPIAAIPQLAELNIGHYLIGEAVFVGLEPAVRKMRELMDAAR